MSIITNLDIIQKNIENSCSKIGKTKDDITLIAVTKTVNLSAMEQVLHFGISIFGESKVQELLPKYDYFKNNVSWHFIGHLQTNKVKYIIDKVELIHSVDSLNLAKEINKQANKHGKIQNILLQVNIAQEESKHGFLPEELMGQIDEFISLKNIRVKGLMQIPPYSVDPEKIRPFHKKLKKISVDIMTKNYDNIDMDFLSMGMTNDYSIAIEEGANLIRIGTGIFGDRHY